MNFCIKNCKKLFKLFIFLIILIFILLTLSGCYDARGIEDLSYITAIGLDLNSDGTLLLTLQYPVPSSGNAGSSDSSQATDTESLTIKCSSINSGISLANSYISKEVNLSHCKVIVFSEELAAKHGLTEYLDTFLNLIEIRPDCNIIISRCLAKDFIKDAQPQIEAITARYYEVALRSSEYTGYTTTTKLIDFTTSIKNTFSQGYAILGGLGSNSNNIQNEQKSSDSCYSGTYVAGQLPIEDPMQVETFGTAVFYDDKLIGELTGLETIFHLLVTNELKSCTLSIPDPFNTNSLVDLHIDKSNNTKVNLKFVNGTPVIYIDVYLNGFGLSLDENMNYYSLEDVNILNYYAKDYVKQQLEHYLYKTSKEFNSDIAGFGKYALNNYKTWGEWIESDWLENYSKSIFIVNVNVNIKSGYEFNNSP